MLEFCSTMAGRQRDSVRIVGRIVPANESIVRVVGRPLAHPAECGIEGFHIGLLVCGIGPLTTGCHAQLYAAGASRLLLFVVTSMSVLKLLKTRKFSGGISSSFSRDEPAEPAYDSLTGSGLLQMPAQDSDQTVRFAAFELDLQTLELRRSGIRLPVQGRPLRVLALLLRTPGQLVTSEQLRKELWPVDTFVDFEHGVRNAVARLRAVLGDTADKPRYIETLPRRGYRFIGALAETAAKPVPVLVQPATETAAGVPATPSGGPSPPRSHRRMAALLALASLIVISSVGTGLYIRFRSHPAAVQIKSLAVLPLENLSGDAAQEYFADGITDELITALAKINSVNVISRTSVMQYKGVRNKFLPQIARELGVDAVVEGTLVHSGDRVRVTAQLIEASTDRHIWADRYEGSSRDMLLMENEISKAIAEQLRGKLDPREQRRFTGSPIDPAAHESYLQGLYLWYRRTPPALEEAIRYFTQAIEKEPRYAEAYTGRAMAYAVLGNGDMEAITPKEALSKGGADAEKAVQLDETSSEAHAARAVFRNIYGWDWRGMEMELQRALELNPSNASARYWYGTYLCNVGASRNVLPRPRARIPSIPPTWSLQWTWDAGCMRRGGTPRRSHQYKRCSNSIRILLLVAGALVRFTRRIGGIRRLSQN